jgi:hypothetical protein
MDGFDFEKFKEKQATEAPISISLELAGAKGTIEKLQASFDVLKNETEKLHDIFNDLILKYANIEAALQNENYTERTEMVTKEPIGLPKAPIEDSQTKLKVLKEQVVGGGALIAKKEAKRPIQKAQRGAKE